MGVLSYMTIDGREVSNSARLDAFASAGLTPSTIEDKTVACGVLQREAVSAVGIACPYLGYSDTWGSTAANVGPSWAPPYTQSANPDGQSLQPQDRTGASDGYIMSQENGSLLPPAVPQQGGIWKDGLVVAAYEPASGYVLNAAITVFGRLFGQFTATSGTYVGLGRNFLSAALIFQSSSTAFIQLSGYVGDIRTNFALASSGTFTVPPGRGWMALRMAGNVITAEWWTQDPRFGGAPYVTATYTLTGAILGGYTSDLLFAQAGYQTMSMNNSSAGTAASIVSPEWWATPTCPSGVAHMYPSPFLYPAPTLYPDEPGGTNGILSTTPWTDTSRPESSDFLGFYIDELDGLDGGTTRSVDQRIGGLGGAALGPLVQAGRSIKVHGWLVARSCRGLDYGREWLNEILASTCHVCPDSILRVRTMVPVPDDGSVDSQGLYVFYDVGLTDGPKLTPFGNDCNLTEVEFTLTTGNGYKYQAATNLVPATTFASSNGSIGVQIPSPPGLGTNGSIITIRAGSSDLLNVYPAQQLATYPANNLYPSDCLYPNDGGLPVTLPILSCPSGFSIPIVPAGGTLVIDSARHRITYTDSSGVTQDGTFLLSQNTARAVDWLEADACNPGNGDYVLVGASSYAPDASVQIDVQHRER